MKFVKTIGALIALLALCNCSGASTATTPNTREVRISTVASLRNFGSYCRKQYDALSWTVKYDIGTYAERQYLDYGFVAVQQAVTQILRKDYEEGYFKYRDLWCANMTSMAVAISESIDEWGPPLTTPGEACRLHPTMQFCINRSKAK
jgi:hypothetical protein